MKRNFELTDETVETDKGVTLYRIRATEDIPARGVRKGDLGGFVMSAGNLSGNAWVYGNAQVFGEAHVDGNAQVYGEAHVDGNAQVSGMASVYGNAEVSGNAEVYGYAEVFGAARLSGEARVYGNAEVSGNAEVYGNAQVSGEARVSGMASVFGDAEVSKNWHVQQVIGIGSGDSTATLFRTKNGGHVLNVGCWAGTVDTLAGEVARMAVEKDRKRMLDRLKSLRCELDGVEHDCSAWKDSKHPPSAGEIVDIIEDFDYNEYYKQLLIEMENDIQT